MSEDAARGELVSQWLRKAEYDRRTFEVLLTQDPPLHDVVCFHAQQCGEKLLKAYLQHHSVPASKTHDLVLLRQLAENVDATFSELKQACSVLSDYGVDPRYPGTDTTRTDAEAAVNACRKIREFVLARLQSVCC
jgi:HEPN domain-containing protein